MEETFEEVVEKLFPVFNRSTPFGSKYPWVPRKEREAFKEGAKWQQERSYSEEEVNQIIKLARQIKDNKDLFDLNDILGFTEICTHNWELLSEKEIFEQFKKK